MNSKVCSFTLKGKHKFAMSFFRIDADDLEKQYCLHDNFSNF